jgi:hypothetical protein
VQPMMPTVAVGSICPSTYLQPFISAGCGAEFNGLFAVASCVLGCELELV